MFTVLAKIMATHVSVSLDFRDTSVKLFGNQSISTRSIFHIEAQGKWHSHVWAVPTDNAAWP